MSFLNKGKEQLANVKEALRNGIINARIESERAIDSEAKELARMKAEVLVPIAMLAGVTESEIDPHWDVI